MASATRKGKLLTLEERVKVIERSEKKQESARQIAQSLGVGKKASFMTKRKLLALGRVE